MWSEPDKAPALSVPAWIRIVRSNKQEKTLKVLQAAETTLGKTLDLWYQHENSFFGSCKEEKFHIQTSSNQSCSIPALSDILGLKKSIVCFSVVAQKTISCHDLCMTMHIRLCCKEIFVHHTSLD